MNSANIDITAFVTTNLCFFYDKVFSYLKEVITM